MARDNLETNPIMIKLETASHLAKQFLDSLTLLLSAWAPLPSAATKIKMSFKKKKKKKKRKIKGTMNGLEKKHKLA